MYFSGHGVVNHSEHFVEPPKIMPPMWVDLQVDLCLSAWISDGGCIPFYTHLLPYPVDQAVNRELKRILTGCNSKRVVDSYIGEWTYCTNNLNNNHIDGEDQWFSTF